MSAIERMAQRIERDLIEDGYDPQDITDDVKRQILAISQEFSVAPKAYEQQFYQMAQRALLTLFGSLRRRRVRADARRVSK